MSDEEILRISYERPSKFSELYDRHSKRFMRIAQRTLRSKDDAEDVVQETFVRIYKYGRKFPENGGKFSPWANVIFKNCLADQINKYTNKVTSSLTDEMESTIPDMEQYERNVMFDNQNYVQFILKKMNGAAGEIINLRYIMGKSFKEIAKILDIKNSTARVKIYRSKKIFLQEYEKYNRVNFNI